MLAGFLRRTGAKPLAVFGAEPTRPPRAGRPRAFIFSMLRAIFSARSRSYGVSPCDAGERDGWKKVRCARGGEMGGDTPEMVAARARKAGPVAGGKKTRENRDGRGSGKRAG